MSNYYLMVTADSETANGARVSAHELTSWRLNQMLWPLYARTSHRRAMAPGDKLLFYQGGVGPGRQTIIGWAEVLGLLDGRTINEIDPHYSLSTPCETALRLTNLTVFEVPVPVRSLFGQLEMLPAGMKHWGAIVMGGCRRLSAGDFRAVLDFANDLNSASVD